MEKLPAPPCMAFTGAGGKSTTLFLLARQLLRQYSTVLVSATTHLAPDQARLADHHLVIRRAQELDGLALHGGVQLVTGPPDRQLEDPACRLAGLGEAGLERLAALAQANALPLLLEADGSRRMPLKAPAEHEPAVPGFVDRVIVVAGLSGLGHPLDAGKVHRPERFAELSGLAIGQPVSAPALASVLAHPLGGLKNIPPGAQRILILNQAEDPTHRQAAGWLADRLLPYYSPVLITALEQVGAPVFAACEPVAGIILAAGAGQRYGQPKQLLEWSGETLVHRAARLALEGGLQPVRVILGAHAVGVAQALENLPVEIVTNPQWEAGQSTSVKAGLSGLPHTVGAAMFLLCDQPFITSDLLVSLRRQHNSTLAPLVAPWCGGRRANPVLFDRRTFPDLLSLTGDAGGRTLFDQPERFPPTWLPWTDERLLLDIDTPEDFQRLKELIP